MKIAIFACQCPREWTLNQDLILKDLLEYFDLVIVCAAIEGAHVRLHHDKVRLQMQANGPMQDFGLWTFGLSQIADMIQAGIVQELCLINDSCTRMYSLQSLFGHPETCYGLTKNWESLPGFQRKSWEHIQSQFLQFRGKVIFDVLQFFQTTKAVQARRDLVNFWEIGLSQFLIQKGHSLHELQPRKILNYASKRHLRDTDNSSQLGWQALAVLGCPLIKTKRCDTSPASQVILSDLQKSRGRVSGIKTSDTM